MKASPVQGEGDREAVEGLSIERCYYCPKQPLSHLTVTAPLAQGSLFLIVSLYSIYCDMTNEVPRAPASSDRLAVGRSRCEASLPSPEGAGRVHHRHIVCASPYKAGGPRPSPTGNSRFDQQIRSSGTSRAPYPTTQPYNIYKPVQSGERSSPLPKALSPSALTHFLSFLPFCSRYL